ncbi:exodeoxyribonuclease V subunit gamma [[Mycobacterium] burgundiense]|uniref:RecBCD enzyme subunit RecC n=1 Tax=[Mycobacterium] burgundiense TaxID=3064286 RepID=A0ABM9M5D1_9MYCO|nr:exodeoxyribonuclease V subunit gamma [Mycolicibacterium sp. MU0053]CAJ1510362.1 exodeoxyribonuclease V subunit gamma [Mycolicibacterium sp. MU0053]
MTFHLHRAERTDLLADGLGRLLATPLPDPFATELVVVPARGVERWLSQRLSHVLGRGGGNDGVCAGVSLRSPRSLIAELTDTAAADPWSPEMLTWPLLAAIDAAVDEPWCRTLATHLGRVDDLPAGEADLRRGRRYAVARRIAGLFASYAAQRPQLLADWSAGRHTDGAGGSLDADLDWQPQLWRAVCARVDADPPPVRHHKAVARLRDSPSDLPARISLFGHTRLSVTDIELLGALSTQHDLHLWLPHPSDALWRVLSDARGPIRRRDDLSHHRVAHPLLATLGRDLRELQASLQAAAEPAVDDAAEPAAHPETLLGWLQSDIRDDKVRPQSRVLADADRSVQVHSCHGPARQIDVLREVLLGLLADDPTLEPRDILVMCPDIETYAPLIAAGFGLGEVAPGRHPAHQLRVRLADRALTQTNALLGVAAQLLALAGGRATAGEVLNFATAEPVRARFGFTDDDLDTITTWVRESGVRWGFDKAHREPYRLQGYVQNTWRFGLDRVLSGVAMSDDSRAWIGTTLPLDDVGSNRVELAGRFAEFVDRLAHRIEALTGTRTLAEWLTALQDGVTALTRVGGDDAWQPGHLHREFARVLADAADYADTALRLSDIRALLGNHLAGRPTRVNFRTGTLTVCTMVPMRSVPHRVVCLVGLDDGLFPRLGLVDGDDVLARRPLTGERDIRSEDRQLLLDAICAATEKLVVTYTGCNEHSGAVRPPAVPLMELLDALDRTTEHPVRDRIVVRQPLQPFDVKNVTPGALGAAPTESFTFDTTALVAARAAAGERPPRPEFCAEPLPEPPRDDVSIADLLGFFRDPVRGFFRALDYTLPWDVDGIDDAMPVEVNALQEWGVGDRMLGDMLRGMHPDDAANAEWRRGALPPGRLGMRKAKEIRDQARELALAARRYRDSSAAAYDVDVELGDRRLIGTVSGVYADRIVSVTYSRLGPKQLIDAWIRLLVVAAHRPRGPLIAVCIGRDRRAGEVAIRVLGTPDGAPVDVLRDLVALYDAGRREPLPLPVKTSYAWAEARFGGGDPERQAGFRWNTNRFPGEQADDAYVKVWGPHARLDALLAPTRPGEEVDGEPTRLGAYAARLWLPLLRAERGEP